MFCHTEDGRFCAVHGAAWFTVDCLTAQTLAVVASHRAEQFGRYGSNRGVPDGTGPGSDWADPIMEYAAHNLGEHVSASDVEAIFRADWDHDVDPAGMTWTLLLREEVAEAFAAPDEDALYEELTQVAALAVSWMEKIVERRKGVTAP